MMPADPILPFLINFIPIYNTSLWDNFEKDLAFFLEELSSTLEKRLMFTHTKKTELNIVFSNDIELKIYAGASTLAALDIFEWIEKEETFQGKDYAYITGIVNLNKIAGIDFNKEFDLFFAVLPQ